VARGVLLVLVCAASLWAQGPSPDKYYPVKLTRIVIDQNVPLYNYTLSSGYLASSSTLINVKERDVVKYAIEGSFLYIVDGDGRTYQCRWTAFIGPPIPPPPPPPK
jgi:hypothetical protein